MVVPRSEGRRRSPETGLVKLFEATATSNRCFSSASKFEAYFKETWTVCAVCVCRIKSDHVGKSAYCSFVGTKPWECRHSQSPGRSSCKRASIYQGSSASTKAHAHPESWATLSIEWTQNEPTTAPFEFGRASWRFDQQLEPFVQQKPFFVRQAHSRRCFKKLLSDFSWAKIKASPLWFE